jgi:hypothetical protein
VILYVEGQPIRVEPCALTVLVAVPIGDDCWNDTGEDRPGWRAEFRGAVASAVEPRQAAEMAYLKATAKPRTVVSSRLR